MQRKGADAVGSTPVWLRRLPLSLAGTPRCAFGLIARRFGTRANSTKRGEARPDVKKFARFLASPEGAANFEKWGWVASKR